MKGLLKKDFYLMRTTIKAYLAIILLFLVLSLTGIYGISVVSTMLLMLLVMIPINAFAYDEQAGWEKYAVSTPAGRKGMVKGRYLFSLCLILVVMAVAACLQVALYVLGRGEGESMGGMVLTGSATLAAVGGLMNAVLLPLVYKFGVQKSRLMLMVIVGCSVGLAVGISGVLADTALPGDASTQGLFLLLADLLGLLALIPSASISMHICQKKDY